MNVFKEIWVLYRPYFIKFSADFLIVSTIWILLYIFKILTNLLPIGEAAGEFIRLLHAVVTVANFGVLVWFFMIDIIDMKGKIRCLA